MEVFIRHLGQTVQDCTGRIKVREALGQIDRTVLQGRFLSFF